MKRYPTYLALIAATALLVPGPAVAQIHLGLPSAVKSTVKKLKVKVEEKQKTTFQSYSAKTSSLGIASFSLPSGEIKEIRITDEASQEPLQDITVILTINDTGSDGLYFIIDNQGKYLPGIKNINGSISPQNFQPKAIPTIVEGLAQTWNDIWGKRPALLDEIDVPYENLIAPMIKNGSLAYVRTTSLWALAIEMGGAEASDLALNLLFAPITSGLYAKADLTLFKKSEWQMEGNAAGWIIYWIAKGYKWSDEVDIYSPAVVPGGAPVPLFELLIKELSILEAVKYVPSSKLFRVIVMRNKSVGTYSSYEINGTIRNASSSLAIGGATVLVNGPSSAQITSDSNGNFTFSVSLPSDDESKEGGLLSINISKKGFYTIHRDIPLKNLISGQAYIFNSDLTPYSSLGGPPSAPSNLQSSALLPGQVNLIWNDNSNDENGFEVEKSTNAINYHSLDVVGPNITSYIDEGLPGNTTYYYRVRGYNVYGNSMYSNETSTTTLNNPPIITSLTANPISISTGAVTTITCTASDADSDTLTYSWSAASGTVSGSGAQVTWTAPASSGTYSIVCTVSDDKGGSIQSSANVAVVFVIGQNDAGSGVDAGNTFSAALLITPGNYTGYISSSDVNDYYKFQLNTGQLVTVSMTPPGSADFDLKLYDPSGIQKASSLNNTGITDSTASIADSSGYWRAQIYWYSGSGNYSFSVSTAVPVGEKKWAFLTGGQVNSSPAIDSDGTIYVGSNDGKLYAFTPAGIKKWSLSLGEAVESSPAIGSDGTIYIGVSDTSVWSGKLCAINPGGTLKWEFPVNAQVLSSPAVGADGTVYVGADNSKLYAVNPDGTEKWEFLTSNTVTGSPAIAADGTIYVTSADFYLYAINPGDGSLKWAFSIGNFGNASPSIGLDGTIYVDGDDRFYAINPNGTQKWVFNPGNTFFYSSSIGADGTIYVGAEDLNTNYDRLYALNANSSVKWSLLVGSAIYSYPAISSDGTIYVGSADKNVYAINSNGTQKWVFGTGEMVKSSPAIGLDGTVYVGSVDYKLYAIYGSGTLASSAWPKFRRDLKNTGRQP